MLEMKNAIVALFRSRKFLLALFAAISTIVLHYVNVPPEVWAAIDAMVMVLIYSIAKEDAAAKSAPFFEQASTEEDLPF